jgi:flagellar biosynthesis/type III secretory pathway protein FliH
VQALPDATALLEAAIRQRTECRVQCEEVLQKTRNEGFSIGLAEGQAAASAEAERAIADVLHSWRGFQDELRSQVGDLALAIVRQLAGELGEDLLVQRLAVQALKQLIQDPPLVIRLHPDRVANAVCWTSRSEPPLQVIADASVERDGCILETPRSRVRTGVRLNLEAVERAFAAAKGELVQVAAE